MKEPIQTWKPRPLWAAFFILEKDDGFFCCLCASQDEYGSGYVIVTN